jgi:hypothetical protein
MWKLGLRPRDFPEKEYINGIVVAVYGSLADAVAFV